MADASNLRLLNVYADGELIAEKQRIRLKGKSTMTCLPDLWQVELYDLSNHDRAVLRNANQITVTGERGSVICSGVPSDILIQTDYGRECSVILILEGEAFWRSTVSISITAGVSLRQTLLTLLSRCSSPIPLVSCPELKMNFQRGQAFFGRTADAVDILARAADCRGWVWQGGLYLARTGESVAQTTIRESDILRDPESMTGALLVSTRMLGLMTGQMIRMETDTNTGDTYRLAAQTVDADTIDGNWSCMLTLMDERTASLSTEAWEGVM